MGAHGAFKTALRNPEHCVAVAACALPVGFPSRIGRCRAGGQPTIGAERSQASNGQQSRGIFLEERLRHLEAQPRRMSLYHSGNLLDCGEVDEFRLHDAAVYLHKLLGQLSVPTAFVLFPAPAMMMPRPERQEAAIRFIGDAET
jgi:S-formylglutathione hydrolase